MPLYEYQCDRCGRFELIHKFSDPPLLACPTCGGKIQKLFSAPAIQFKGAGFYVNDYAKKPSSKEAAERKGSEASSSGSGDDKGATKDGSGKDTSKDTSTSKDSSASGSSPAK